MEKTHIVAEVGPAMEKIQGVASGLPSTGTSTAYEYQHDGMLIRSRSGQDFLLDADIVRQVLRLAGLSPVAAPASPAPAPEPAAPEPPRRRYSDRAALSLKEAGELIGVSAKTLRRRAKLGELTLTLTGDQLRVELSEVYAYLRRNRISEKTS